MSSPSMNPEEEIVSRVATASIVMNDGTLGSALDAMEQRIRNAGFQFEFTSPKKPPSLDTSSDPATGVSGMVLRSKALIELAIIQAIGTESTGTIVNTKFDAKSALKQGNVVALRSLAGGFLDMKVESVVLSPEVGWACLRPGKGLWWSWWE